MEEKYITFAWEELTLVNFIISLVFIVVLFGLLFFVFYKISRRKLVFVFWAISFAITFISFLFAVQPVFILCVGLTVVGASLIFTANIGDLRSFIANPFKKATAKAANFGIEKIYDRGALYKNIETAVLALSKTRTGALITFEKNSSLKDIMKNGVPVKAPVSAELLQTIFYPGTRLHDGAVVIHGNEIVAASVFFTPTTQPFAGKYGSRHRAAIGISEVCDAVTVVVSEETGRISFAVNGQLEMVDPNNFLKAFELYMADGSKENDIEE